MAVRQIRIWPDPALAEVARPVQTVDSSVRTLIDDLFDTMYAATGVGLAATQIAEPIQVLVIDLDSRNDAEHDPDVRAELDEWGYEGPQEFINPVIVESEGSIVWEEGCLSVPGYTDKVKRKKKVTVTAINRNGEEFTVCASGLYSVAIQHEMDHLTGRVFVEYLSKLKRDLVKRKMNRIKTDISCDGVEAAANL